MQTVSTAFQDAETSSGATFYIGAQVAWQETLNSSYNFFTIGTSTIGGPDFIPGTQVYPSMMDKYQYTDESAYMLGYMVTWNLGQYPYGVITSNATLTLDNTTMRYTPNYDPTIGAYVGLSGRPVKLSFGFDGAESIGLFAGYTTGPSQAIADRSITQNMYDAMNYFNDYISTTTPVQINQTADQIIIAVLQEMGLTPDQYIVEQSTQLPIGYYAPYGQNVGQEILYNICEAEQGIAFFDQNGVFHFWNREHIANITSPSWTFDYNSIIDVQTEQTPVINSVEVTGQPRAVQAKQLVWQLTSAVQVSANGTYTLQVDFTDNYGDMPVTALDTPTYQPNGTTDSYYQTNLNSDGSGTDPGTVTVSSVTLSGTSASIVFANSYAQPVWVTTLLLYGTPAKVTYVIDESYTNPASITANGLNPANNGTVLQINHNLIQSPSTALSDAYMLVNDYATPNVRVIANVFEVPQLQLGDMVTLTFNDSNTSANYTVVGNTMQLTPQSGFSMELELEVKQLVHYFQINVSTIGGTDQIAPG